MAPPPYPPSEPHLHRSANTNSSESSTTAAALCIELLDGNAPEWVQLLPAGPEIEGRDGRKWRLDDPGHVALSSYDADRDLPIDYEHATEIKAPDRGSRHAHARPRTPAAQNRRGLIPPPLAVRRSLSGGKKETVRVPKFQSRRARVKAKIAARVLVW